MVVVSPSHSSGRPRHSYSNIAPEQYWPRQQQRPRFGHRQHSTKRPSSAGGLRDLILSEFTIAALAFAGAEYVSERFLHFHGGAGMLGKTLLFGAMHALCHLPAYFLVFRAGQHKKELDMQTQASLESLEQMAESSEAVTVTKGDDGDEIIIRKRPKETASKDA